MVVLWFGFEFLLIVYLVGLRFCRLLLVFISRDCDVLWCGVLLVVLYVALVLFLGSLAPVACASRFGILIWWLCLFRVCWLEILI